MITNCEKYLKCVKCVKISIFICNRWRECVRFFLYDDLNRICIKLDYCNVSSKLIFRNDIFLWTNMHTRGFYGYSYEIIWLSSVNGWQSFKILIKKRSGRMKLHKRAYHYDNNKFYRCVKYSAAWECIRAR